MSKCICGGTGVIGGFPAPEPCVCQTIPAGHYFKEDLDGGRLVPKRDWTYSEGCGCRITFIGASDYHTSRMLPGDECEEHTRKYQVAERDAFVDRAKKELLAYLGKMEN